MSPIFIMACVAAYSILLFVVVWYTSRNADNESFFIGNKSSKWYIVAYGMIGASLSGVTFMSVPGWVGSTQFSYMMVVFGYLVGYAVIAMILLPLYYRMNLTSIYTYLEERFGTRSYKTGAFYFILSRTIGASFRLYIVVNVLQTFVLDAWGVPFWVTVASFIGLILLYTYKGGVKTIVWTDTLQTTFMLLAVLLSVIFIARELNFSFSNILSEVFDGKYSRLVNTEWQERSFWVKQFFGGMFIAIAMTGLDQEMMQKNISVKNLKDSQKNMMTFTAVLMVVNLLFLVLGGILYLYAAQNNINVPPDDLFATIALSDTFSGVIGIIFIIALISALFPSVDGAITSLTSCFCIDILGIKKSVASEKEKKNTRLKVHFTFAVVFFLMTLLYKWIDDKLIIDFILKFAGITYGPLLGLFAFGILTKRRLNEKLIWAVCIIAPMMALGLDMLSNPAWYEAKLHISFGLQTLSDSIFNGYKIGNELILINGIFTFFGLWFISKKSTVATSQLHAV